jgi:hypothetical protein
VPRLLPLLLLVFRPLLPQLLLVLPPPQLLLLLLTPQLCWAEQLHLSENATLLAGAT